jgi:ferric-dicitrate binding protein FerR (iron transport regulator)
MNESQLRQLLDKYLQGKCSPEETKLLHQFYDSFPEEPSDTVHMWLSENKIHEGIRQRIAEKERQQYSVKKLKAAQSFRLLKIAASILIIIGVGLGSYFTNLDVPVAEIAWVEKATQKGQRATITLMDGTIVYLNANSKISFPEQFSVEKREVILEGEAFFEVTRNVKRPFTIQSGELTTTVLGTSFNIRSFAGEPQAVSVATGKVKVSARDKTGYSEEIFLTPNQQAYYDGQLCKNDIDIRRTIAWKDKIIHFDDVTLAEAALELENWFGVSIRIEGENIKKCKINAQYIDENLTNILESFKHILGINYQFSDGRNLLIEGEGCNTQK